MTFDFRSELEKLAEKVTRNPLLEVLSYEIANPLSINDVTELESHLGIALPPRLRNIYQSMNGAQLRWRFRPELDEQTRGIISEDFANAVSRDNLYDEAGAIEIVPLSEMLFSEEYALPQNEPDEGEFIFDGHTYSSNEFCKILRPFDAIDDTFAMAFVVQQGVKDWKMLFLSDYWIEYDCSRITYLDDYLKYVISTWGLVNARDEIFSDPCGDLAEPVRFQASIAEAAIPSILKST